MKPEPANPFYRLLLVCSVAFAVTAFAYAVVPWDDQPAWFRAHGWKVLLAELAAVIVFGLLSMILDRLRTLRKQEVGDRQTKAPSSSVPNP